MYLYFSFYNTVLSTSGQYNDMPNWCFKINLFYRISSLDDWIYFRAVDFSLCICSSFSEYTKIWPGGKDFNWKIDILRQHVEFYNLGNEVGNNIKFYYEYLWQRHKEVVYGKHHFDLLSNTMKNRFEKFHLVGKEIYLDIFYQLKNKNIIDQILKELKKVTSFLTKYFLNKETL